MQGEFKIYAAEAISTLDGRTYGLRYLLTPEEKEGLQLAGLLPQTQEVVGMQRQADQMVAGLEKQRHTALGGVMQ